MSIARRGSEGVHPGADRGGGRADNARALRALQATIDAVSRTNDLDLEPMKRIARMLRAHETLILN